MTTPRHSVTSVGHTLVELLLVVAVLGICFVVGTVGLNRGLAAQEARGAAQDYQVAAGWAQLGVLWNGGTAWARYGPSSLSVDHDLLFCGGELGASAPVSVASSNVARWSFGDGVQVAFGGSMGAPDGGGSLYFEAATGRYRVVVRPESGLTVRSYEHTEP